MVAGEDGEFELGIGNWDGKDDVAALGHRDSATVVTAL